MSDLKVFNNDVVEWVVAHSAEDANAILVEMGQTLDPTDDPIEWQECPPEEEWTLDDADGKGARETHTFADWASLKGRGYLGTTEY